MYGYYNNLCERERKTLRLYLFVFHPDYDAHLCSILLDYDFNKLEDIWFTSASNFTMATIELLLELPELLSIGIIFKLYPFPHFEYV
jgi:hypothetical protein